MNRGILATCYGRPAAGAALSTATLLDALHAAYDAEPFVVVIDGSPSTKATLGVQRRPRHRPLRRAHRHRDGHRRPRQPHQGRLRRCPPVGQRRPRPRRDRSASPSSASPHETHRSVSLHPRVSCGDPPHETLGWRRRDRHAAEHTSPTSSSRRCRTSAASPARRSSSSTAATPSPARPSTTPSTCSPSDIVLMRLVGLRPVVVHGGGPQISSLMDRLGKTPEFRNGLRVTDAETVDIARMVLIGQVNPQLVTAINLHGDYAVGVSGEDAGLIRAVARDPALGFVGDVARINPAILDGLLADEFIPVVATIGTDDDRPGRTTSTPTSSPAPSPRRSAPRSSSTSPTSRACAGRSTTPATPHPPDDRRRARGADRRRHDRRRHDPEGRQLHPGRPQRRRAGPHPRRPHRPRAAARDLHRRRHRHDGRAPEGRSPPHDRDQDPRLRRDGPRRLPVHARVRAAADHVRERQGHRAVGQRGQALPRLPRRPRRDQPRPQQPGRRRGDRDPGQGADARQQPVRQPRRDARRDGDRPPADGGHRPARPGVLHQLRRRGQRVRAQAGPQARRARPPRRRQRPRQLPRAHARRRSRPPASRPSTSRSSRCRRASTTSRGATSMPSPRPSTRRSPRCSSSRCRAREASTWRRPATCRRSARSATPPAR